MSGQVPDGAAADRDATDRDAADRTATSSVIYDPLVAGDAVRCAELELVLFRGDGPWSAASFLSEIGSGHTTCLAARSGDLLVGYAALAALGREGDREFEVHTIGVDPAHRGRGIGRTMLRRLLAVADAESAPVVLDVRTDNVPARSLYESHGFEVVGLRPRYYRPSMADAHLMVRPARYGPDGGEGNGS